MGKRSDFARLERDHYRTPWEPVVALSPFLSDVDGFAEPCCGDGTLIAHLERLGHECRLASDLEPIGHSGMTKNALLLNKNDVRRVSHVITNPPWPAARGRGEPTMSLIRHLSALRPTWLLLNADFAHNGYASEVLSYCSKIVSVGRVKWMPGTKHVGYENAAWYLFDQTVDPTHDDLPAPLFFGKGDGRIVLAPDLEALL